jgi:hypothetical protein
VVPLHRVAQFGVSNQTTVHWRAGRTESPPLGQPQRRRCQVQCQRPWRHADLLQQLQRAPPAASCPWCVAQSHGLGTWTCPRTPAHCPPRPTCALEVQASPGQQQPLAHVVPGACERRRRGVTVSWVALLCRNRQCRVRPSPLAAGDPGTHLVAHRLHSESGHPVAVADTTTVVTT